MNEKLNIGPNVLYYISKTNFINININNFCEILMIQTDFILALG